MSLDDIIIHKPKIGVFRLQLFKPSETFIAGQVVHIKNYFPLFIGRKKFGPIPDGKIAVDLDGDKVSSALYAIFATSGALVKKLVNYRLELLHVHFAIDALYALPIAQKLKIPMVTTLHGFDVTTKDSELLKSKRPALMRLFFQRKKLQKNGAGFICVSEFIRNKAIEQGYPEDKTILLPIGIDLEKYKPVTEFEFGRIAHIARLVEKKGTLYLLQAIAKIYKKYPQLHLNIYGDGPLRSELEGVSKELGIDKVVTFRGMTKHDVIIAELSKSHFLAVPSVTAKSGDAEGLPTVIFEAGALGVPCLASYSAGIPEAVKDHKTGLLAQERDIDGIAIAIEEFFNNSELRNQYGQASRELMETDYDVRKQTIKLEKLYADTIKAYNQ